jgi:hypothetical protein
MVALVLRRNPMRSTPPTLASLVLVLSGSLLACTGAPDDLDLAATEAAPSAGGDEERPPAPAPTASPPAKTAADAAPYPAPHPSMPQIPRNRGAVLHDPSIVSVTFPGDPLEAKIQAFGEQVGSLKWWSTVHADYGVGAARSGGHVTIADAPPTVIMDSQVHAWIAAKVADGTLPPPTDQTLYTLYYPASTSVRFDASEGGGASCQLFLGYHSMVDVAFQGRSLSVAYAVINRCGDLDMLTRTASHEFTEASTDPHPSDAATSGYVTLQDNAWTWLGGENADMCAGVSPVSEAGWSLTRVWSNSAAKLGGQPCVPMPDGGSLPYFNAGLVQERLVASAGSSASTEVDCYSFGALPSPIQLTAKANNTPAPLSFSFDRSSRANGDKATLTVSVAAGAARGADYDYTLLANLDAQNGHLWRGVVHVK